MNKDDAYNWQTAKMAADFIDQWIGVMVRVMPQVQGKGEHLDAVVVSLIQLRAFIKKQYEAAAQSDPGKKSA